MIKNIIVESIRRKEVTPVVCLVKRPVVAQALGAEHQCAVISQLVVFNYGEGLKGFTKADAIGNYAATEAVELVNSPNNAVALEFKELLPDNSITNASGGLDDTLFVHVFATIEKKVVQDKRVYEKRIARSGHRS